MLEDSKNPKQSTKRNDIKMPRTRKVLKKKTILISMVSQMISEKNAVRKKKIII